MFHEKDNLQRCESLREKKLNWRTDRNAHPDRIQIFTGSAKMPLNICEIAILHTSY